MAADFVTGTVTLSLTGCITVPTGNAAYIKSLSTGLVFLRIPDITGTSNTTGATLTGLSAGLFPLSPSPTIYCFVTDSSATRCGTALISASTGIISLRQLNVAAAPGPVATTTAFTASGIKGFASSLLTYIGIPGPP